MAGAAQPAQILLERFWRRGQKSAATAARVEHSCQRQVHNAKYQGDGACNDGCLLARLQPAFLYGRLIIIAWTLIIDWTHTWGLWDFGRLLVLLFRLARLTSMPLWPVNPHRT